MPKVRFEREAREELKASVLFYEGRAPGLGEDFLKAVEAAIKRIQAAPARFRGDNLGVRICPVSRFPFTIRFVVEQTEIWIVAMAHEKRRPGYWRTRF